MVVDEWIDGSIDGSCGIFLRVGDVYSLGRFYLWGAFLRLRGLPMFLVCRSRGPECGSIFFLFNQLE